MVAIALSLAASTCWGVADFVGGLKSRRLSVVTVLFVVELSGLVVVVVAVAAAGDPFLSDTAALAAAGAGLAGTLGLGAFYRALAIGTMSIVAPISATGVALPVAVGVLTGERPSGVQAAGLALAIAGVVLASREVGHADDRARRAGRAAVGLALVAALGFGGYFVGADRSAEESVLWTLVLARGCATLVILVIARVQRAPLLAGRRDTGHLAVAGLLDLGATGLFALATTQGLLSIVAVVGALYPVMTVMLARGVLGERIATVQAAGIAGALGGVALIAAG